MDSQQTTRPKRLTLAVALALCSLSAGVSAVPLTVGNITLDAEYSLGGSGVQDGMLSPPASIFSNANGADMYLSTYDSSSNSVFFHTYGFTGTPTYFGARASGSGTFSAYTRTTYSNTYFNTGPTAMPFIFSFQVEDGQVGLGTGYDGSAELMLRIAINNVVVARDQTTITRTGDTTMCVENDEGALGSYMECGSGTASSGTGGTQQTFNINVGMLDPGVAYTLDYDIIATVSGSLAGSGTSCGYPEDDNPPENGYVLAAAFNNEGGCFGENIARSGDPFNGPDFDGNGNIIPGTPISSFDLRAAAVPEPGSLWLLAAAGVAAAGVLRRRRKR